MTDAEKKLKEEYEKYLEENAEMLNIPTSKKGAHIQAVANYNKKNYNSFSVHLRDKEYDKMQAILFAHPGVGKSSLVKILIEQLSIDEINKLVEKSEENKNHPAEETE